MTQFAKKLSIVIAGLVLAGAGAARSSHAATNGLAAAYGFNEGTGSVLHDLSGNGNNGTITGASWVRGKYGGGLRFNGSSSRVTVPSSSSLSPTGAVTVEAWIRPQLAGSWRAVAIKEQNSADLSYGLYGSTSKGASAYAYAGSERSATGTSALPLSTWSHVAAVFDGTMLRLYVNGSLTAQQLAAGSIAETAGAFRIGGDAIWGEWFSGTIDELRVYGRALTASQIQVDMGTKVSATGTTSVDAVAPTAPTGLVSSSVTQTSAVLSWTASSDNVGVSGYGTYRNGTAIGSTSVATYTFSGLTCGTSYSLSVDAFDTTGNRSAKTAATITTAACSADTQAPTGPTGLASSSVTQTSAVLSWSASSDNVGVTGYGAYRNGTLAGSTSATAYTFSGLTCGTSYSLSVDAVDAAANRSAKTAATVVTAACTVTPDTTAPSAPGGLTATGSTQSSVSVSWSASSDNVAVAGYGLYRSGTLTGSALAGATTQTFASLACGTSYVFGVDAFDGAGNRSVRASVTASTSVCTDTQAPSVPGSLVVSGSSQTSVSVSWLASTDNVAVAGYGVYLNGVSVGSVGAGTTSQTFGSLTCGTSYTLAVDAFDAAGNRSVKASLSGSTAACGAPPPAGSANLWVDTSGGSCVRSAAGGAYVDAQACGSLNAAYAAASGGDTINVRCGSYGGQTINSRSLGSSVVKIQKDPGDSGCGRVTVSDLTVRTSYILVSGFKGAGTANNPQGFSLGSTPIGCGVSYTSPSYPCALPYSHITLNDFAFNVGGSDGVSYATLSNGELGPLNAQAQGGCAGAIDGIDVSGMTTSGSADGPNSVAADHFTVDNVWVHDIVNTSGCGGHTDAIQGVSGYNHWTIQNSRFTNDATCVLAYSTYEANPYVVDTITIRNNVFDGNGALNHCITIGNKGVSGSSACGASNLNNLVENNTFTSGLQADVNCIGSPDGVFRNNIVLPSTSCGGTSSLDWSYDYNIFQVSAGSCNTKPHSKVCAPAFTTTNHSTGNADLASSDTCAVDWVPLLGGAFPTLDIHGAPRPQRTAVDAGAMELP